jgi:hypothetical protein
MYGVKSGACSAKAVRITTFQNRRFAGSNERSLCRFFAKCTTGCSIVFSLIFVGGNKKFSDAKATDTGKTFPCLLFRLPENYFTGPVSPRK